MRAILVLPQDKSDDTLHMDAEAFQLLREINELLFSEAPKDATVPLPLTPSNRSRQLACPPWCGAPKGVACCVLGVLVATTLEPAAFQYK